MLCLSCRHGLRRSLFTPSSIPFTTITPSIFLLPRPSQQIIRRTYAVNAEQPPASPAPTTAGTSTTLTDPSTGTQKQHSSDIPFFPSSNKSSESPSPSSKPQNDPPQPPHFRSSTPGGLPLRGLAYLKSTRQVTALEDEEYPSWLWTLVDLPSSKSKSPSSATTTTIPSGISSMKGWPTKSDGTPLNKKQLRKVERKREKLAAHKPREIPIQKQTVDLTGAGATAQESLGKRKELVKAMRRERRVGIREENFLRGM